MEIHIHIFVSLNNLEMKPKEARHCVLVCSCLADITTMLWFVWRRGVLKASSFVSLNLTCSNT